MLFGHPLTSAQLEQAQALIQESAASSPLRLDIGLALDSDLSGIERTMLKLGSQ